MRPTYKPDRRIHRQVCSLRDELFMLLQGIIQLFIPRNICIANEELLKCEVILKRITTQINIGEMLFLSIFENIITVF
jgi:hypothetical protein